MFSVLQLHQSNVLLSCHVCVIFVRSCGTRLNKLGVLLELIDALHWLLL